MRITHWDALMVSLFQSIIRASWPFIFVISKLFLWGIVGYHQITSASLSPFFWNRQWFLEANMAVADLTYEACCLAGAFSWPQIPSLVHDRCFHIVYVNKHTHTHTRTHTHIFIYIRYIYCYTCIIYKYLYNSYKHTHTYIYIYINSYYTQLHTHTHIYIFRYTCMHACIHACIHTCIHPSMHAYIHRYIDT